MRLFVLALTGCLLFAGQACPETITVDENGNGIGTSSQGYLSTDPTSGVLTLTYDLPFTAVSGDVVLISSPAEDRSSPSDLLRFDGNKLFFFSDQGDSAPTLADVGVPVPVPSPTRYIDEVGTEGNNGAPSYMPGPGDPGYASGPTYHFISDGSAVPEPATITLLLCGAGALGYYRWRRRRSS